MDKKDEALKLALGYMDGTLVTNHLIGYERKRHVTETIREALAEQPAQQCKWPTCQSEEYQQALAEQIKRELVGDQPQIKPLTEEFNSTTLMSSTSPPQRTRVGLTDEQIEEIAAKTLFPVPFARAIEAELKENT